MKELLLNEDVAPVLRKYEDGEVPAGYVRAKSIFGAPKHGTEMTAYKEDPFANQYYDEDAHIFRKREKPEIAAGNMGLGNMWIGNIIEIGEGVTGFEIGERVAGYGNLRHTHTAKAEELLKMPESMTWQEAVCFDPLQFALGGIRDGNVRMGDKVLISGLGAIGLIAAQVQSLQEHH
ncbi:MAG TPA: alcohol dehydrogenase catalytic domain-containing protein [Clostridia bacterium]|nr:alcohol dehydrogenase catalytic domain-containing protein [Clostridia bacterium]